MTFQLCQLCYVLAGLLAFQSPVRGDAQQIVQHHVDRIKRDSWPTVANDDDIQDQEGSEFQKKNGARFLIYTDNPLLKAKNYGHDLLEKQAGSIYGLPPNALHELAALRLLYNPMEMQFSPVDFHEFLGKQDPVIGTRDDVVSPYFDEILYLNNNDADFGLLRAPQFSYNFVGKRLHTGVENNNLWKRIPLELFTRRAPYYSHSFVGKRSADSEARSSKVFKDTHQGKDYSYTHGLIGKRSANSLPSSKQVLDRKLTYSNFGSASSVPASKIQNQTRSSLSHKFTTDPPVHSVKKRAITIEKRAPAFGHRFVGKREDYAEASFPKDRLEEDSGRSDSRDEFNEHANFELDQEAAVNSVESPEKRQQRHNSVASNFMGKRPNYSHKFIGKRNPDFDQSFAEKRPNFGHRFVGKRPSFGHRFVGKRLSFGHRFVGKRPSFGHRFVGKRPNFGHRFVGKRLSFGHKFVGKRPSFGHRFVGKRPSFGHKFIGKRPNFGHRFIGKRLRFGHSFVGKRNSQLGSSFIEKRPKFGHSFIGKRGRGFGHRFVGKRVRGFENNFEGKGADDNEYDVSADDDRVETANNEIASAELRVIEKSDNDSTMQKEIPAKIILSDYLDTIADIADTEIKNFPSESYGFTGERVSNFGNTLVEKRGRGFGHRFIGKREDIASQDGILGDRSDTDNESKLVDLILAKEKTENGEHYDANDSANRNSLSKM